ncbi:unnamed protein product [Linum tenue]|nr:unnamed protein product [Linum tenue]
MSCGFCR